MSTLDQVIAKIEETKWYEWRKRKYLTTTVLQETWDLVEALVKSRPEAEDENLPDYRESDTGSSHQHSGSHVDTEGSFSSWSTPAVVEATPSATSRKVRKIPMGFQPNYGPSNSGL